MCFKKNLKSLIMLGIALALILVSSFFGSLIQSRGWSIEVTDLRDETNTGQYYDAQTGLAVDGVQVKGEVVSGILYMPKKASETNKLPAVVLTHGYLNSREHQLPNAVELARRGFIVLTIDRDGHGNNEADGEISAMMATKGLYDSAKYLYNLPEVDKSRIGISGHSMGGMTTTTIVDPIISSFMGGQNDVYDPTKWAKGEGYGIISAALIQGWSTIMMPNAGIDVGILKAKDDEFFFTSTKPDGTATICREYLQSTAAAGFVGDYTYLASGTVDVKNAGIYVGGKLQNQEFAAGQRVEVAGADVPFRVVYESEEIHPLNHFSTESTGYVVDFFYKAFGTPNGFKAIKTTNQVWVLKEIMATLGWVGIIFMIFPLVSLLLNVPFFSSIRRRKVAAEGAAEEVVVSEGRELKGLRRHLSLWIPAVAITLFSGFSISPIQQWASEVYELTPLFPQDTTNWVAVWAICCGLFAIVVVLLTNLVNRILSHYVFKEDVAANNDDVFAVARVGGARNLIKNLILAIVVVGCMYLVLFANWAVWKVDFRFWTFNMKVFNFANMLPTMVRYAVLFGIFYVLNAICNQTYRFKNLPEWASIAINAVFNVFGIGLVFAIQYIKFTTTGVMWKPEMNLSYIVLFPIIPTLICATIISRVLYKKTGNIWLGALINTILWTMVTVAGTAASFPYILG